MLLKKIKYNIFESFNNKEWSLDGLSLGNINLIVGRNASGKTKTLKVIKELGEALTGDRTTTTASIDFQVEFEYLKEVVSYSVSSLRRRILEEKLMLNNSSFFTRKNTSIFDKQIKNFVAEDAFKSKKGYEIYKKLAYWGNSFHYYPFAGNLGQHNTTILMKENLRKSDEVVSAFIAGRDRFRNTFNDLIIANMKVLDYDLEEIGVDQIHTNGNGESAAGKLFFKEKGLATRLHQEEMSQGMFRAFSLIIQINYALMANIPSCIVIDDIGEGLDYERAKKLIGLLIQKAEDSSVQLVMATNDRFIMNAVPLKYWTVLERSGHIVKAYNYENNKETFEEFEFTGLNNFDFFATEFYKGVENSTIDE